MDQQVVALAALLPLLSGTLNAFQQAELVPVFGEPDAELRPGTQQRLVCDLDGLPALGVPVADQKAGVDEAPEQRQDAARQVVEQRAAAGVAALGIDPHHGRNESGVQRLEFFRGGVGLRDHPLGFFPNGAFQLAQGLVFVHAQAPIVAIALVEPTQRERQEGQRIAGAGVVHHGLDQAVVELHPGQPRRALDG